MTGLEDAERLRVTLTVDDIDSIREVLECLERSGASVRPDGISPQVDGTDTAIEVDVSSVTPKQWEALELAFERGYYHRPREVELAELADELSISKSAVSQRLRAAETKLVAAVLEVLRPSIDPTPNR